ncbi:quinone oxidoreductase family protein, partial [Fodinicola feengrottensis]
ATELGYMSDTMNAFQVHAWGQPPRLQQIPVPTPKPGEALVRIEAAAVGHLDFTVASGEFVVKPELPYVGGVEGAGVIVSSDQWASGTKVTVRGEGLGTVRDGTWSEYVAVSHEALTKTAVGLSPEWAATAFNPLTTAHIALHEVGRLGAWPVQGVGTASDEVVVVAGAAGAVGSIAVQLALRAGARVIGLVSRPERAKDVPAGAEVVTLAEHERLAELAAGRTATLLVDTWGGPEMTVRGGWLRPGGRTAVIGYVHGSTVPLDIANWMFDDIALLPVNMLQRHDSALRVVDELTQLVARGELTLHVTAFPMVADSPVFDLLSGGLIDGRACFTPMS